jgi:Protein of unknown function (DUF2442)
MNKIIEVKLLGGFLLLLKFNDGESKKIDFESLIGQGISSQLLDKEYFKLVTIDNGGGIEWPNGMDFCPNFLKEYISAKGHINEPHIA